MELLTFQSDAAAQVAERFADYAVDPLMIDRRRVLPFVQTISAVTGAGKTLILAETVSLIRGHLPVEPMVLWLSTGKVVVWQTFANLSTGKYAAALEGFTVKPLADCTSEDVSVAQAPLVLVATAGKFNQRDKEEGDRRIYRVQLDVAEQSLWDLLKSRQTETGIKRPLLIVFDESQNLSNQMTELLLELGPDAIIGASATAAFPPRMQPILDRLRNEKGWGDEAFVTAVPSAAVVSAGLVKERIQLGGYVTPMELAVDDLLAEHGRAVLAGRELGLRPKAIYVTETNTVDGSTDAEDVKRPFAERRARPVLIWRHLVSRGVDPSKIAVYLQLKFDKRAPPPPGFILFSGADDDYDRFVAGEFQHVIFNRTLQEGWDDPACGFAYIDKSMGSSTQVTQVIGRVLRQPGGRHYSDPVLNTAHFYIRTDAKGVFEDVLRDVENEITTDATGIKISVRRSTARATPSYVEPKGEFTLPSVNIYSGGATTPMRAIMDNVIDFSGGGGATRGVGAHIQVLRTIGDPGHEAEEWAEVERGNPITARTLFRREVHRLFPGALGRAISPINLVDIEDPKFDALVEFNSQADAHLRDMARQVVDAYIEHSIVVQDNHDLPFRLGPTVRDETAFHEFENAAHAGYSKLNELERPFAEALDRTGLLWCRNPDRGGFEIPLLDRGPTRTFNPDFIVWTDEAIFAIDPKADHLIREAAVRKLFALHRVGGGPAIQIRLVTRGAWTADDSGHMQARDRERGFTVWRYRNGRVKATAVDTVAAAVATCLQSDDALLEVTP